MELTITCGLPRSGKTTWAKQQQEQGGWVRICPDDIRRAVHGQQFIATVEPYIWAIAETMVRTHLIGGCKVLLDATNTTRERRRQWQRIAQEFRCSFTIFWIATPFHLCEHRNHGNGAIPANVLTRMHQQFEVPTQAEGQVLIPVANVGYLVPCEDRFRRIELRQNASV